MTTSRRARPSGFAVAEHCQLAGWLAARYPESNPAMRFGSLVDRQVSRALAAGAVVLEPGEALEPETEAILAWVAEQYPRGEWEYHVQRRVHLRHPLTDEALTDGTPDLVVVNRARRLFHDVDWKKRGQMWGGRLGEPGENLQQLIYVAAKWLELSAEIRIEEARVVLAFWDGAGVDPRGSDPILEGDLMAIVSRVEAVPPVDADGPAPEAGLGPHCDACHQKHHCTAHLMPGAIAVREGLVPFGDGARVEITEANVRDALSWIARAKSAEATIGVLRKYLSEQVNAYVDRAGPVAMGKLEYRAIPTRGKRSGPTVAECEARGLFDLIRPGRPGISYDFAPQKKGPVKP